MTTIAFTTEVCDPYGQPALEMLAISRPVLEALVASAHHLTERYDLVFGTSAEHEVRWQCRADCPVCLAKIALGDEGLL